MNGFDGIMAGTLSLADRELVIFLQLRTYQLYIFYAVFMLTLHCIRLSGLIKQQLTEALNRLDEAIQKV